MNHRHLTIIASAAFAVTGLVAFSAAAHAQVRSDVPLIERDVLFGNPERASAQISPDGKHLSFLAPVDGVLNVWVAPIADPDAATAVTHDAVRGVRRYFWAFDSEHILFLQDVGGDEDWQLFSVELTTGKEKRLTTQDTIPGPDGEPMKDPNTGKNLKPTAQINQVSHHHPDEILVGLNNRNPQFHDLYRINIHTGDMKLVQENPGQLNGGFVAGIVSDDHYNVRFIQTFNQDASASLHKKNKDGEWSEFTHIPSDDSLTTGPAGFNKTGNVFYMLDSRDRNTGALRAINLETGDSHIVAEHAKADVSGVLSHPTEYTIQAVNFNYLKSDWQILDPSIRGDFRKLRAVEDGEMIISSRSLDDSDWIVVYVKDDGPVQYYHYDRDSSKVNFLFTNRPELEGVQLAKMHPVVIQARDNLDLVSYLTLPVWTDSDNDARPDAPQPMVLLVHGGPWARDTWGYNSLHQLLANRGYAVLSVNFRGSTGFGKNFTNAGDMEWAGKMHDDLIDAVDWAIAENIADPDRVAIMGGSYGGYATLVGLTFTPDKFAAGVDIVGPSNIVTLFESIPPYWRSFAEIFRKRVGDHSTEEGRAALMARSPITRVDAITKPLLIGQGANDPRVKQAESDQIVNAMQKKSIPVTYVLFPDEGHGFARPENNISFFAVSEAFLAEHLGGRYQPIDEDFEGSSITVPEGAALVPGLADASRP